MRLIGIILIALLIAGGCGDGDDAQRAGSERPPGEPHTTVELTVRHPELAPGEVTIPFTAIVNSDEWSDAEFTVEAHGAATTGPPPDASLIRPHQEFEGEWEVVVEAGTADVPSESLLDLTLRVNEGGHIRTAEVSVVALADDEEVFLSYSPRIARKSWMISRLEDGEISQSEYDEFYELLTTSPMPPGTWRPGGPWAIAS